MPSDPIDTNDTAANREQSVETFYDDNTNLFLKLGQHGSSAGIHQPLYIRPGVPLESAIHTQHDIILKHISEDKSQAHILDLGCGVGASMLYMATKTAKDVRFTGLTISETQSAKARQHIARLDLSDRISVLHQSYLDIPTTLKGARYAYAIESFIHATDADAFFREVSGILEPKGSLILFDDFLTDKRAALRSPRVIKDFRDGWKANALYTVNEVASFAEKYGLTLQGSTDHSPHLDLWRTRDKLIAGVVPFVRPFVRHSNYATFLVGGNARQQAFRQNLLAYMELLFVKH